MAVVLQRWHEEARHVLFVVLLELIALERRAHGLALLGLLALKLLHGVGDLAQRALELLDLLGVVGGLLAQLVEAALALLGLLLRVLDLLAQRDQVGIEARDLLLQLLDLARLAHNLLVLLGLARLFVGELARTRGLVLLRDLELVVGLARLLGDDLEFGLDVVELEQYVLEFLASLHENASHTVLSPTESLARSRSRSRNTCSSSNSMYSSASFFCAWNCFFSALMLF